MKTVLLVFFCLFAGLVQAQNAAEKEVIAVIDRFFEGMEKHDTTMMRSTLDPSVRLQSVGFTKEKKPILRAESVNEFLVFIAEKKELVADERLLSYEIRIDGNMATAWTPYEFYMDGKFSHCGVNAFQLFRNAEGWRIHQITDTRRREGCGK